MEMRNFDDFVKEHYAAICAIARRFVSSATVAQDIAQEVIIKFWETPSKEKIESVSDYLFIMTKNFSLNYLRSKEREDNRNTIFHKESSKEESLFNIFVEEEYNQLLMREIEKMPKERGRVIRYALSGYNNKEISKLLGISINTVKTIKYAEIRRLRQLFDSLYS